MLRDLIFPSESKLKKCKQFNEYSNKWNVNLVNFSDNFWKEVNNTRDASFIGFLNKLNRKDHVGLNSESTVFSENYYDEHLDISVYFPYSQEFLPPIENNYTYDPIVNIVTATADADEGWGSQAVYLNGVFQHYQQVLVNDNYAFENPTHIIGVNGIEYDFIQDPFDAIPPPNINPNPNTLQGIYRVFHGSSTLNSQYDRLISFTGNGGGSEVKVCRISGYLQIVNQQVTNFQGDIVSIDYSRRDIRKKLEKRIYGIWHPDWTALDGDQVYAVYEEDTEGTASFNGNLSTTVTLPPANGAPGVTAGGSVGFNVSVKTQDNLITQRKISRAAYFGAAFGNQGCGFSGDNTFNPPHSWPIYDCGTNFKYTWPYNTY